MNDLLLVMLAVGGYWALLRWVLPRLGVST